MKKFIKISALLICLLFLVGCSNKKVTNEVIFTLSYSPGGSITKEDYDKLSNNYTITGDGQITDKNNIVKQLSKQDLDTILDYYDKFCNNQFNRDSYMIPDGPSYTLTVYKNGLESLVVEYNYSTQTEYVQEIANIVVNYYK